MKDRMHYPFIFLDEKNMKDESVTRMRCVTIRRLCNRLTHSRTQLPTGDISSDSHTHTLTHRHTHEMRAQSLCRWPNTHRGQMMDVMRRKWDEVWTQNGPYGNITYMRVFYIFIQSYMVISPWNMAPPNKFCHF